MPTGNEAIANAEGSGPLAIRKGKYLVTISLVPDPQYGHDENGGQFYNAVSRISGSFHNTFSVPQDVKDDPYRQDNLDFLKTQITGCSQNAEEVQVVFTEKPQNKVASPL